MLSRPFGLVISADNEFFSWCSLILIHAPVRFPASYREPLRLPIRPSREHFKPGARKSRGVVHLIGWAASWNTILSPKLTISTFGFGGSAQCIRKKDYAVPRRGGLGCCHDARKIKLGDLHFRINERFLYEGSAKKSGVASEDPYERS